MKTKITLTNPTDDELSAAVATHAAKWKWLTLMSDPLGMWVGPNGTHYQAKQLPFATSADAVLPLLAAHTKRTNELRGGEGDTWKIHAPAGDDDDWSVCPIWMHHDGWVEEIGMMGEAPTFPRAACIALLRANGVEVIT